MKAQPFDMQLAEAIQSDVYVQVRRRVFRQLIESMLYERIVSAETVQLGKETLFLIHGRDKDGVPITYNVKGGKRLSFGRIRLSDSPPLRIAKEGRREADDYRMFLQEVLGADAADKSKRNAFVKELEATLANDAIAQRYRRETGLSLTAASSFGELETAAMDGHPYHPCYKSRIGFTLTDQAAFGPEFAPEVRPVWLAIRQSDAAMAIEKGRSFESLWKQELGQAQYDRFMSALAKESAAVEETPVQWALLPVHPWQWRNLAFQLSPAIRDGEIVPLGQSDDAYRPQQSIRTMSNATTPAKSSIKLAMSLLNTSSYRHIEPHDAVAAPYVSAWLKQVVSSDAYLMESGTILLAEYAAVAYDPSSAQAGAGSSEARVEVRLGAAATALKVGDEGALSCIWRESLEPHLKSGERAVPFHALSAIDIDGTPFIEPWLQQYGIEKWLSQLFEAAVMPVVHLLGAHGIALESHAQNMALVHRDGRPVRAALKDFHEDAMYYRPFLSKEAAASCPDFTQAHRKFHDPRQGRECESLAPLRYMLLGALYCINLAELAMMLADRYRFEERRFWTLAAEAIETHLQRYPQLRERFDQLDLFGPTTKLEQLTRKRLVKLAEGAPAGSFMHEVSNPLHLVSAQKELSI
ncbi:IucA/IucC family protein [Paenibacillus curdlanolyticus YK9]|uniref:IucA/IucC family protein n=1 Tax=Paenibacillus curdlanolyticus YK9 TaxID=717606 RepID=E0IAZ1_9BACL|nr:IucA/IucC family protein [Paenibacillus curdlanolyticus]EFM10282.1 IucA/IucC family protein [Paenibacillus curdlanolyticus YK9]